MWNVRQQGLLLCELAECNGALNDISLIVKAAVLSFNETSGA